ncbi:MULTISPECIES: BREX system ATP-binding protein BrxD [unclassified Nocardioides]|uniref:BREX system ATP-binding protein BrxD n=1 Tax=unclassified Nocardioides TaxID=2615069 RepID=UPI0007003B16|nr:MULTISPECIES: BREX system ATP-binding protein BrxD [unclassified Nocardioides]KRA37885.1 ATP-binding protein [Nocardioides sp. Root614]KRA91845.1 ATP-binding protein [Nocardioides sp. Root682]
MTEMLISPRRRRDVIDALRRGTVPQQGLDVLAVGLSRFEVAIDSDLQTTADGGAGFKAVRGEYGSGKTFFARWLTERAKKANFATAEIQISETETPLHKLETVYRRVVENLATPTTTSGALRDVIDGWFYFLDQDAGDDTGGGLDLLDKRLAEVSKEAPAFAAVLRSYRLAQQQGDAAQADGLLAWLGGQPHVSAAVKRAAGVRGDLDHFGALGFLQGLLTVLRDSDYAGLVLVLDEVETLQRMRSDVREKSLNALRQLLDEIDAGRFPGLYVVMTGTPAFFDGQQGVQRLPPLAQRLQTDFQTDARFDNPRAAQIRLTGFTGDSLVELGARVRDIYATGAADPDRLRSVVDDDYVAALARAVGGELGGRTGVAPRLFLKKLIADVLDRVDLFEDFNPRRDYRLTVTNDELTEVEREAHQRGIGGAVGSVDDIDLEL